MMTELYTSGGWRCDPHARQYGASNWSRVELGANGMGAKEPEVLNEWNHTH
jgi:hypothetical protein